eukprot:GHRQ01018348.1.p1 GENE.GHRQ01018348.1~~GHRQ01018348.1.p1  ORF type:complete len:210 (-),score=47.31 GHRQ01018348.1:272-901(-)
MDATGAFTTPAVLRNVHITGNNGSIGAAVRLGPYTSVVIESSSITGNTATSSVIYAGAGAVLRLINNTISGNNGTGVAFTGSRLSVCGSTLAGNTAVNGSAISIACPATRMDVGACRSQIYINDTWLEGNRATGYGGAVYMRDGTYAALHNVTFERNSAREGGAVVADRDACLFNMTLVTFQHNKASDRCVTLKVAVNWEHGSSRSYTS